MKLYNSVGPNPHVVRMFIAEKGLDVPKQEDRHQEDRRQEDGQACRRQSGDRRIYRQAA